MWKLKWLSLALFVETPGDLLSSLTSQLTGCHVLTFPKSLVWALSVTSNRNPLTAGWRKKEIVSTFLCHPTEQSSDTPGCRAPQLFCCGLDSLYTWVTSCDKWKRSIGTDNSRPSSSEFSKLKGKWDSPPKKKIGACLYKRNVGSLPFKRSSGIWLALIERSEEFCF